MLHSLINLTFRCPCAHHEDLRERGGTTPRIINPALLHTVPSDNSLATILGMLTFLLLHNISLAIKWNSWLFHSLHILVSLLLWVMIFAKPTHTAWHKVWLWYYMNVCDQHYTRPALPLRKKQWVPTEQEAGWARDLAWKPWRSEKSLIPARNLTSTTHSPIWATAYQPHQLHCHSSTFRVSLILNRCVIFVKDCFYNSHFSFNPYPTAFPYGNGIVLHFYQQQESSTTKTVHRVINKGLKTYVYSLHTGENFH